MLKRHLLHSTEVVGFSEICCWVSASLTITTNMKMSLERETIVVDDFFCLDFRHGSSHRGAPPSSVSSVKVHFLHLSNLQSGVSFS